MGHIRWLAPVRRRHPPSCRGRWLPRQSGRTTTGRRSRHGRLDSALRSLVLGTRRPTRSTKTLWLSLVHYGQSEELPRSLAESIDRASGDASRVTRLSKALSNRKDRFFTDEGLRIEQAGRDAHEKVVLWRVISDSPDPIERRA